MKGLLSYINHYFFDKTEQIKKFHNGVTKIRELIKNKTPILARMELIQLKIPTKDLQKIYLQVSKEVEDTVEKYEQQKRREAKETEEERKNEETEFIEKRDIIWEVERNAILEYEKSREQRKGTLDTISHQNFELKILKAFELQGYKVTHTAFSGDEGVDGFLEKDGKKIAIQCKKHKDNIGQPDLRDFLGAMIHFGCNEGIFITTSDFTEPAKTFAKGKNIQLLNRELTINLLQPIIKQS